MAKISMKIEIESAFGWMNARSGSSIFSKKRLNDNCPTSDNLKSSKPSVKELPENIKNRTSNENRRNEECMAKNMERYWNKTSLLDNDESLKSFSSSTSMEVVQQVRSHSTSIVGKVKEVEVTNAVGTKCMRNMNCPTVLIKAHDTQFSLASVHYVLLEPKFGPFKGQIPALLFSNPSPEGHSEVTHTGELLPLVMQRVKVPEGSVMLKPMLLFKRYQCVFKYTSAFLMKVISIERRFWKVSPKFLKGLLFKDIQMFPKDTLRELKPLRHVEQRIKRVSTSSNPQSVHLGDVGQTHRRYNPRRVHLAEVGQTPYTTIKLSELFMDQRLPGLKANGLNRDFAAWFEAIPPNAVVDVNFICDNGIFQKDNFQDPIMLDIYLGLSRVI